MSATLELPELTVDMDGVLCRPILWFNLVISRDIDRPPEAPPAAVGRRSGFRHRIADTPLGQTLRYAWRPPMPEVHEGLAALAELRRLVLLSGRPESARQATEHWLKRHGLAQYFAEVVLNNRQIPNAAFKLATARARHVCEHVDDDGRVAFFLAQDAPRRVYLIAWRRNAGLPYPATVERVRNLQQIAAAIRSRQPTT